MSNSENPPEKSSILVEIHAGIAGWPAGPRFDVALHGQITSTAPAEMFSIRDQTGVELAALQFGHGDDAVALTQPNGETLFRTGFQVYLPMAGGDMVRIADTWVRAQDRAGAIFEASMRVGCMEDRAAILAGPAHDMSAVTIPAPQGIVYLEAAGISADGLLLVTGWTVSVQRIVAVQIFIDGDRIGPASHGRERADVAEAYPSYPNARNAGFVLERAMGPISPNARNVMAQVLCLNGACHAATIPLVFPGGRVAAAATIFDSQPADLFESGLHPSGSLIPASDPPDPHLTETESAESGARTNVWDVARTILVICDQATLNGQDTLLVEGWAACGNGIARVEIEVDGRPEGAAEYGRERTDVAAEYPGMPLGTGFVFERNIPRLLDGRHEVRVIATSLSGDAKDVTVPVVYPTTPAFRFELDIPVTRDGLAVDPITGRMTIEGWALARGGIAGIDVSLDGVVLGSAHYGVARPDVGAAFPDWDGAVRSGYTFHCPSRALPDGEHDIALTVRSRGGAVHVHAFRVTVRKTEDPEEAASIRRRVSRVEQDTLAGILDQLSWHPAFDLFVSGDGSLDEKSIFLTIRAIAEQSWPARNVTVLAADRAEAAAIRLAVAHLPEEMNARFRVADPSDDGSKSGGAALTGESAADLIGILALGDELGRDALGAFALASGLHPEADCFYADEFRLVLETMRPEAFFKPDYSPVLLQSGNYIGRPLVVRPGIVAAAGVTADSLMRDGFFDAVLRCTEAADRVWHVRELLSRTDGGLLANQDDGFAALTRAMARRGIAAAIEPGLAPRTWNVRPAGPAAGKVSIVIPTRAAKGHIETCLRSLRGITANQNFEVICAENIPDDEEVWKNFVRTHADKVLTMPAAFNWSRFNNLAAGVADGEYLLFLNDDIEIVDPGWLDALLEDAARPHVGIVGARLLYPNRTVQHAGMFLGSTGTGGGAGIGRHAFRHAGVAEPGYFGLALTRREVIAVTGACLLVRRDIFERLGGFDEAHDIINNDLDFCLRAHRAGLLTVYTPYATLIHHELASRENLGDTFDTSRFSSAWRGLFAAGDPYFNPHLARNTDDYQVDDEGIRAVSSGHPLIRRDQVKNILAVKLDHIGDFVTALPAMRRLKALFPAARLTVLAGPISTGFAATEPAIDAFIPFEFFHARSQLGEKDLTQHDLDALTARLAPYRFDIAVDLRKHLSTRHILRCSGARILAGYDSLDRFPWLDIALEWEGDKALQHKRSHITDDLLQLVGAIDAACEQRRDLIDPRPAPMALDEIAAHARHLFSRPVVAIHPGAGNITKQWPEIHIVSLIDLLIEHDDVCVLLVGGTEEADIAASILERVGRIGRAASVVGDVTLRDLPRLLAACALYIGNDSGPKHIAAAMGVPTIGVHSGVVDPGEWAPFGERAVALYRNMSCAPCYLSKAEDCPRGLACIQLLEPALVHQMAQTFLARPVAPRPPPAFPLAQYDGPRASPVKKRAQRAQAAEVK